MLTTALPKMTTCKKVTYYELGHGRYMAAPMQNVTGYVISLVPREAIAPNVSPA